MADLGVSAYQLATNSTCNVQFKCSVHDVSTGSLVRGWCQILHCFDNVQLSF